MGADTMTPTQQVELHELVEDARRVLLARHTEEGYAFAALLSQMRGVMNDRVRNELPVGLIPHRIRRACDAVIAAGAGEVSR